MIGCRSLASPSTSEVAPLTSPFRHPRSPLSRGREQLSLPGISRQHSAQLSCPIPVVPACCHALTWPIIQAVRHPTLLRHIAGHVYQSVGPATSWGFAPPSPSSKRVNVLSMSMDGQLLIDGEAL